MALEKMHIFLCFATNTLLKYYLLEVFLVLLFSIRLMCPTIYGQHIFLREKV